MMIDPPKTDSSDCEGLISDNGVLQHLAKLLGPQTVFLPVPPGSKNPGQGKWQQTTFEQTKRAVYQAKLQVAASRGGNIGCLLGPASDDLVSTDFDTDSAADAFLADNPPMTNTLRSRGARGCQIWMRMIGQYPAKVHTLKNEAGIRIGEWRGGGGAQSIIYGKHPSGCNYQFLVEAPVIEIAFTDIHWPTEWRTPWNNTLSRNSITTPTLDLRDQNRFRRAVREQKIPIRLPDSLDSIFAKQLGMSLAPYGFFERAGRGVKPEFDYKTQTYQLTEADPYGFRTDLEAICAPYVEVEVKDAKTGKKQTERSFRTIPINLSRTILASKDFLQELRPLLGFSNVRLPIRRPNGRIELLAEGYDEWSGVLTISGPGAEYTHITHSLESASAYLRGLLSEFCFIETDKERAISVAIAGMLTLYCRLLLGAHALKPAFLYTANAEGAGKTLLAKLAIIPVLGSCPTGTMPKDEDEFRKRIFACALVDAAVLFIDNVIGHLRSPALASFVTSPIIQDRLLGVSRLISLEHNAVAFITGNQATYSPDIRRRTLTIELFLAEMRSEDRTITHPLDDGVIFAKRTEILAALWTLVDTWANADQPKGGISHASFPQCSELIGGILEHAKFASPFTDPHTELSGDTDTRDMEKLVDLLAPGKEFTYDELLEYCRSYGLFERLIPAHGDQDAKQCSKFGNLLKSYGKGRILKGRYEFQRLGETRDTRVFVVQDLTPGKEHQ